MRVVVNPNQQKLSIVSGSSLTVAAPGPQGAQGATGTAMPVGSVIPYVGSSAPSDWLLADGTAYSRTTYATLFALIGTTYGSGDGSTTFNLPDMRQRFPLGKAASGTGATLGGTGGTIDLSHTHSVPAHYHAMGTGADLNITSSGAHIHTISGNDTGAHSVSNTQFDGGADANLYTKNTSSTSHTHASGDFAGKIGLVTGGVDGNAAMTSGTNSALNPPFMALNYIIKF